MTRAKPTQTQPAHPSAARRTLEAVHLTALGVWLGSIVATGVFAAIVFGAVRELDPSLPAFAGYEGSHADLLAGFVQNRVFAAVDIVQFVSALLALASMIGLLTLGRLSVSTWSSGLRIAGLGIAMGLVSFYLLVLMPRMAENVRAYWSAAEQGQTEAAAGAKAAFDADHPTASGVLQGIAAAVALSLIAGAVSASGGSARGTGLGRAPQPTPRRPDELEVPDLARRKGTP
jgi:hypothetical protein